MENFKIEANEKWFLQLIDVISEGGKWVWKDRPEYIFTKKNGKLEGNLEEVAKIVSPEFLAEHFIEYGNN